MALLSTACTEWERAHRARVILDGEGEVVKDKHGGSKAHPACAVERDALSGFRAAVKQLNLDLDPLKDRAGRPGGR